MIGIGPHFIISNNQKRLSFFNINGQLLQRLSIGSTSSGGSTVSVASKSLLPTIAVEGCKYTSFYFNIILRLLRQVGLPRVHHQLLLRPEAVQHELLPRSLHKIYQALVLVP